MVDLVFDFQGIPWESSRLSKEWSDCRGPDFGNFLYFSRGQNIVEVDFQGIATPRAHIVRSGLGILRRARGGAQMIEPG